MRLDFGQIEMLDREMAEVLRSKSLCGAVGDCQWNVVIRPSIDQ